MTYRSHNNTVNSSSATRLDELTTDERELFDFICLLIDIQYRQRYGGSIEHTEGRGYSKHISGQVLADELPSVDSGLQGKSRREVSGL